MHLLKLLTVDMSEQQMPEIRRVGIGHLTIYEISESELEMIERGTPDSLSLTISVFLFSTAVSFSVSLATTTIDSDRTFQVFIIITVLGYILGLILLIIWLFNRKSTKSILKGIRCRSIPEGDQIT